MSATPQASTLFRHSRSAAACLLLLYATGCHSLRSTQAQPTPPPTVQATPGTIVHVDSSQGFCVVKNGDPLPLGSALRVTRRGVEVARLSVTGPARYPFVAADIRQGMPRLGDRVQLLKVN